MRAARRLALAARLLGERRLHVCSPLSRKEDAATLLSPPRPGGTSRAAAAPIVPADADLKAAALFHGAWRRLENRLGLGGLQAPRELIFLNGAPGAGKGANAAFVERSRGLERTVCVSSLLAQRPDAAALMATGALVSDALVIDTLLGALLDPSRGAVAAGAVIDGFPRTALQCELLSQLHDKLLSMHDAHADHVKLAPRWPRPSFRIVVLFVDEELSVRRQLERGVNTKKLRDRALLAGVPLMMPDRETDASEAVARQRYALFKAHYSTLLSLKHRFPWTLVDACGTLAETEAHLARELRYQSSLELSAAAYSYVRQVSLATALVNDARRALVARLDTAARKHALLLQEVVELIASDVAPVLSRAALSGHAVYSTHSPLLADALAREFLTDVLSDRGFGVEYELRRTRVPVAFSVQTGAIDLAIEDEHRVHISCERALLRTAHTRSRSATLLSVPSFEPLSTSTTPASAMNGASTLAAAALPAPSPPLSTLSSHTPHESEVSEVQGGN